MAKQRAAWLWLFLILFFLLFLILFFPTHKVFFLSVSCFQKSYPLWESTPGHFNRTCGLLTTQPIYQQRPDDCPQPHGASIAYSPSLSENQNSGSNPLPTTAACYWPPFPMGTQPWHGHMSPLCNRGMARGPNLPGRQGSCNPKSSNSSHCPVAHLGKKSIQVQLYGLLWARADGSWSPFPWDTCSGWDVQRLLSTSSSSLELYWVGGIARHSFARHCDKLRGLET